MVTVKVSPKYQIVIPKYVREAMKIRPGQKIRIFALGDRIEIVPVRKMSEMRGIVKDIDTTVEREDDRV